MLNVCIDILCAIAETAMLYSLMRTDNLRSWTYVVLTAFVYVLSIRAATVLNMTQTIKLLVFLAINTLYGSVFFQHPFMKSLVLSFLHLISIYIGELSVQSLLLVLYKPGLQKLTMIPAVFVGVITLSKLVGILCSLIFKRIFGSLEYPYKWKLSFCLLFPLSMLLWTMAKLQEIIFSVGTSPQMYEEALLATGLLVSMICLLFVYQYYFRIKELQLTKNISDSQMLSIFRFYEDRMLQDSNNRKIYHDIQAHIHALERMQPSNEKTEYGQELLEQLYGMNFSIHTGVEAIDVVLNEKKAACTNAGVMLICIGDFTPLGVLKPMELVTLFHNAIDNALQEYKRFDYPEKLIEIQSWTFHNFLHLRFMNYYLEHTGDVQRENPDLHGFGLKNMAEAVARYNGEVIPTIEDGHFYLRVIIPLAPQNQG